MNLIRLVVLCLVVLISCGEKQKKAAKQNNTADSFKIVEVIQERMAKSGVELTESQVNKITEMAESEGILEMKKGENEDRRAEVKAQLSSFRKQVVREVLTDEQRNKLAKSRGNR